MPVEDPWLPVVAPGDPPATIRDAIPIKVYRYEESGATTELDNVHCLQIQLSEGTDPGTALFRYVWNQDTEAPATLEEALSGAPLPKTVEVGDRLVVKATLPDTAATEEWIFDGYALHFRGVMDHGTELVLITATGVAITCRDKVIPGKLMRDSDQWNNPTAGDVQTDLIAQFNPRGRPNAVPTDQDSGTDPKKYPVFVDETVVRSPDGRRKWDLAMATRYILKNNNDETFVKNPDFADTDALLVSREPIDGTPFDPADSTKYTAKPLIVPDTPMTGRDWPSFLQQMFKDFGFGVTYELTTDSTDTPITTLKPFHHALQPVKQLVLQGRETPFDPALTNVGALDVSRELEDVANQWVVEGAPKRYEASFILKPGFPMNSGDSTSAATLQAFDKTGPNYNITNRDAYRLYIFDETGEGHYNTRASGTKTSTASSLDALLGSGNYAKRRRKPIGDLFTTDSNQKPLKAKLSISKAFTGTTPGIWDRTATDWQPVQGGWELLPDRLGIRINCDNPNAWKIGKSQQTGAPYPTGVVRAVEEQSSASFTGFTLRLTCVIEGDQVVKGQADRRDNSPVTSVVERKIDARDRYSFQQIATSSEFNSSGSATTVRDDTDDAKAEAMAVRVTTEAGALAGSITIPRLTRYYEIGDRIDQVEGRDLSFRTNTGGDESDAPIYPYITAIRWTLAPHQETHITMTDAGQDRGQYERAITRGKARDQHAK